MITLKTLSTLKGQAIRLTFLLFVTLLPGCSDDPEPPFKNEFVGHDETIDLTNAKLYLLNTGNYGTSTADFKFITYFISDGQLISGKEGWALSDYTEATYFFMFQVIIPDQQEFEPGDYTSRSTWMNLGDNEKSIYLFGQDQEYEFYENLDTESTEPTGTFHVSGSFEIDETLTIKYSGQLSYWKRQEGGTWLETPITGKLQFNKIVNPYWL